MSENVEALDEEPVAQMLYMIEINLRDGHVITQWFKQFDVEKNVAGGIKTIKWVAADGAPTIVHLAVADIIAIRCVDVKIL